MTTDEDGAIVGGTPPFLNNDGDDMDKDSYVEGAARRHCRPQFPPSTAAGSGRGVGGSNPTISAMTATARTMERTRKAATATAKMVAVEAMVMETTRAHSRHTNIKKHIIHLCLYHATKAT